VPPTLGYLGLLVLGVCFLLPSASVRQLSFFGDLAHFSVRRA
jgi:hypothetical protein